MNQNGTVAIKKWDHVEGQDFFKEMDTVKDLNSCARVLKFVLSLS